MPVYVEIAGRAYPLRFTLRGALRLLDLTGQTPMELLAPGLRNTALLLYAALCDGCPHVTLSQAAALCAAAARERDALSRLLSALALALAESGLDQTRLDRDILRRLLRGLSAAACAAGRYLLRAVRSAGGLSEPPRRKIRRSHDRSPNAGRDARPGGKEQA